MSIWSDPIIEEVRRIKQEIAAEHKYDIHALCEHLRRRERESGRTYVTLPPRPVEPREPTPMPPLDTDVPIDSNSAVNS